MYPIIWQAELATAGFMQQVRSVLLSSDGEILKLTKHEK